MAGRTYIFEVVGDASMPVLKPPARPGIYILANPDGRPLYVETSDNLAIDIQKLSRTDAWKTAKTFEADWVYVREVADAARRANEARDLCAQNEPTMNRS